MAERRGRALTPTQLCWVPRSQGERGFAVRRWWLPGGPPVQEGGEELGRDSEVADLGGVAADVAQRQGEEEAGLERLVGGELQFGGAGAVFGLFLDVRALEIDELFPL